MHRVVDVLLTKPPSLDSFFSKPVSSDFVQTGRELLYEKALTPHDEVSVEEVFDHLSAQGFRFLFPKILQAYQDSVFSLDGNLAARFCETVWHEKMGLDRKHGRGKRADMFAVYAASLPPEHRHVLETVIKSLEMSGQD